MIARKDDEIWDRISEFGQRFPPFAFKSHMGLRPLMRTEAIQLGVIRRDTKVAEVMLPPSDEFKERLATKLSRSLEKLEEDEQKCRTDPLTYGTGYDLLELAEEKLDEIEDVTPEDAAEIRTLVEKALEKGFGEKPDYPHQIYGSLAHIYNAIGEPEKGRSYQQQADEASVAFLLRRGNSYDLVKKAEELCADAKEMTPETVERILRLIESAFEKGAGAEYNVRSRGHRVLATVYEQTQEPEKAETHRVQAAEWADGFTLLTEALEELKAAGGRIDKETGAKILEELTKAAERIPESNPERHAEVYRATGEILEAWGDTAQAIEYYEYAIQKDQKAGVKRRLNALRKSAQIGKLSEG